LTVRLSGAQAAVSAAEKKLGGDAVADGAAFWDSVREQAHAFFTTSAPLWRLSVPSVAPSLGLPGASLIEWGGAQRWLVSDTDPVFVRAAASAVGGHASLFRHGDKSVGVFHPLAPAITRIHHNLKATFDPAGVFNPGRMYPDL
ncbi:glycolate oxidase subunit GlcE, partial [Glaciimonas sp. GG7]